MSTEILFDSKKDKDLITQSIADVRNDSSATNYTVIGHKDGNPNILHLIASGSDGYEGLSKYITSTQICYAFLRVETRIDLSLTIKFVYIHFMGEEISFAKRGKYSVVHGAVLPFFQPYHVDFDITSPRELSPLLIKDKVEKAAGNADFVRDREFAEGKPEFGKNQNQKVASELHLNKGIGSTTNLGSSSNLSKNTFGSSAKLGGPSVSTQSFGATLDPKLIDAIKLLRENKSLTYVVGTFKDAIITNPVILVATGGGSVEEMKPYLQHNIFAFALVRLTDLIDGHSTIKFVFINWLGKETSMMSKAKVATFKGAMKDAFGQMHIDFTASEHREISDLILKDKVSAASGSKSFVK